MYSTMTTTIATQLFRDNSLFHSIAPSSLPSLPPSPCEQLDHIPSLVIVVVAFIVVIIEIIHLLTIFHSDTLYVFRITHTLRHIRTHTHKHINVVIVQYNPCATSHPVSSTADNGHS